MNIHLFNVCLATGWLMLVQGMALLVSAGAALVVGGLTMIALTLLIAFKAGVGAPKPEERG